LPNAKSLYLHLLDNPLLPQMLEIKSQKIPLDFLDELSGSRDQAAAF
jgi:hypothetical protein